LYAPLTSQEVHIANYPFATIDPNVGVVPVPDERVDKLADMSKSKKRVPAVVEFYDIAGLVRGAYKGEGLGNQFLSHIRNVQVIVHIVRCFENNDIVHVEGNVNPIRDIDTIESELIFKDLDTIEKRLGKLEADARSGDKQAKIDLEILKKAKEILGKGELLTTIADEKIVKELQLLTSKQQIFLLNGKAEDVREDVKEKIRGMRFEFLIADLSDEESLPNLVKAAYFTLSLISFFTTGEDETRAWTIERGMKAPQAAGVIHTDFENKFIRAEVVNWEKLLQAGGWSQAKQKGWLRLEGKDYVVEDGDVMVIRHG